MMMKKKAQCHVQRWLLTPSYFGDSGIKEVGNPSSSTNVGSQEYEINLMSLGDQMDPSLDVDSVNLMSAPDMTDIFESVLLSTEIPNANLEESSTKGGIPNTESEKKSNNLKQEEPKPSLNSLPMKAVNTAKRQAGQKTSFRRNPMSVLRTGPPRTQKRTTINRQANGNLGTMTRGPSVRIVSNAVSSVRLMQSPQQNWNHFPKPPAINSIQRVERIGVSENKSAVFGNRNSCTGIRPMNTYMRPIEHLPIQHMESEYFIAMTYCHQCNVKKEHLLSKPGMWPPTHCFNCGVNWHIIEWKTFICEDDDDIVYAGEVINSPKIKRPVYYGPNGIKLEPVDDCHNTSQCLRCGGLHKPYKGQPYIQGYCPQFQGGFSGNGC